MPGWQLAQLNIAQGKASIDAPEMADFVAQLDEINALAERTQDSFGACSPHPATRPTSSIRLGLTRSSTCRFGTASRHSINTFIGLPIPR